MRVTPLFMIVAMAGAILSMALGYMLGGYATTGIDPAFGARHARMASTSPAGVPAWQATSPAGADMTDAGERGFDDRLLAPTD